MELSDRKRKILHALVEEYISTAEPVGSRAISKNKELGLSSATIRNEMADLEEMGYLVQPHTSAGRVPSDNGYKLYVNSLMTRYRLGVEAIEELRHEMESRIGQLDRLIKKAGFIAASLTNYATVVALPEQNNISINKIDLVNLGDGRVILIVVTQTGVVRNRMISLAISDRDCEIVSGILRSKLCGMTAAQIDFEKIRALEEEISKSVRLMPQVLVGIMNFVYETISEIDDSEVYVGNAKSILDYPEYNNIKKAQDIFGFLEDKEKLKNALKDAPEDGIGVRIGADNNAEELKDCSLVTMNYSLGDKVIGRLGVIGPKRMDYAKVFAGLNLISEHIDGILKLYNDE